MPSHVVRLYQEWRVVLYICVIQSSIVVICNVFFMIDDTVFFQSVILDFFYFLFFES